ncbi:MAG TPA: hypothetical protein QGE93_06165 [Acidobacteriota bacterium]|nr:hypothetical protein [Acidobacteriota bacterium]
MKSPTNSQPAERYDRRLEAAGVTGTNGGCSVWLDGGDCFGDGGVEACRFFSVFFPKIDMD